MSVQPALPASRRTVAQPRRAADTRRRRVDPPNAFNAAMPFAPEPARPGWIETTDATVALVAAAPLGTPPVQPAPAARRWWTILLALSLSLHVAVAAFFMLRGSDEEAQIAGAEEAGVVMLGDADADQQAAGDLIDEATNVTIVTMLDARPVETVDATEVAATETLEAVSETVPQVAATERLEPVPTGTVQAAPAEPTQAAARETLPEETAPAETMDQPAVASPLPEVLATDTPEIVEDAQAVAPAAPVETAPMETRETVAATTAETLQPSEVETVEPAPEPPVVTETPKPVKKKVEPPKTVEAKKSPPERKAEPKAAPAKAKEPAKKAALAPAKKAETTRKAGSGGQNASDARRGKVDGQAEGNRADKAGKGKSDAAGNAAVTNYPGQVRSRISRTVRRIPASARRSARGDVVVSFTVTASGALGGVSVARSSGSPALDKAAIEAVRRAAPFPPIPDGRKSWPFTIPLGLR